MRAICNEHRGVYALDYDALVARHGRARWHDEGEMAHDAHAVRDRKPPAHGLGMDEVHSPLTGVVCKVLAVDLDNTLWGGILGEDGIDGIQVGPEYPGAYYRSLQRAILDLYAARHSARGMQQE